MTLLKKILVKHRNEFAMREGGVCPWSSKSLHNIVASLFYFFNLEEMVSMLTPFYKIRWKSMVGLKLDRDRAGLYNF